MVSIIQLEYCSDKLEVSICITVKPVFVVFVFSERVASDLLQKSRVEFAFLGKSEL